MKRKFIVITLLTLIFVSLFTSITGAETVDGAGLTLSDAQKEAEANSKQAVIDDLDIKAKEAGLNRAKSDAKLPISVYGNESIITERIRQQVKPIEAETSLELAKMTKEDNAGKLKRNIKSSFLYILLAQRELELANKKLGIAKERLEMTEARYSTNIITEQDLVSSQNDVFSKTIDVEGIKENLRILDMRLKDLMGLPLDGEMLVLEGTIELESFPEVDIEKVISTEVEKDIEVYSTAGKYYASKRTLELIEGLLKPGNETYDRYEIELAKATRDYESIKRNCEINIRNTFNDLLNLRDSVELAIKFEELQIKILDNAKIIYGKGLMSKEEYIASEEKYLDAVYSKYKAICDFNIKNAEFLNLAGIE